MKQSMIILALVALFLSACGAAGGDIEVHEPWARAAMAGEISAAYMIVHNHSSSSDALIGASSDAADAVEIHLSQMGANGEMQMIPQESVPLAAGEEAVFQPGGLHIMLIGLKKDLKAGDTIQVTLHFKNHADITVDVPVQEMEGMDGMDHQHMP
jgi:copper(I)-binding protein